MPPTELTSRIAKERNCSPEFVRAIVTDILAGFHECAVKEGIGTALVDAYWGLGALGAWHFGGILFIAAEQAPGELAEHYARLDPSIKQFLHIKEQWEEEVRQRHEL